MASTTFSSGTTIASAWLNDVNSAVYNGTFQATQIKIGRVLLTNTTDSDTGAALQLGVGDAQATTRSLLAIRTGGYAPPADAGNTSNGDKLILWNNSGYRSVIGLDSNTLWFQSHAPGGSPTFQWHGGEGASSTEIMRLAGPAARRELLLNITTKLDSPGYSGIRINSTTGGFVDLMTGGTRDGTMYNDATYALRIESVQGSKPIAFGGQNGTGVQAVIGLVASAANYIVLHGRSTGNHPVVGANGSDTNINLYMVTKGTGYFSVYTNGAYNSSNGVTGANEQFRVMNTANSINVLTVTGAATGNAVSLSAVGGDANVSIQISSVLAGNIILQPNTGDIKWGKANVALGGGDAPTLGTIGGSGPATAAQRNWLRFIESDGTASFIPVWR